MSCAHKIDYGKFCDVFDGETKNLVGKILTQLEAVISSEKQLDSAKKIIKGYIWQFNDSVKDKTGKLEV
jgi:CRISPR/Cas system-associated endonuclease Cas1